MVNQELALTAADLQAMEVVTLTAEHPKNGPAEYTGVRLNAVLDKAGVTDGAGLLVLTASDGYSAEVPLADVQACADCLIAIDGSVLNMVMPGMSSKAWVKDVVKIDLAGVAVAEPVEPEPHPGHHHQHAGLRACSTCWSRLSGGHRLQRSRPSPSAPARR